MPGTVNADNLQTTGGDQVVPRTDFPLSNWVQIDAGAAVQVPHTQTGANITNVAMISIGAFFTGLFEVFVRAAFSDNTTAGAITNELVGKQGAAAGLVAGGVASGKFGSGANSLALASGMAAPQGMVLNVDAAGGGGLTFEGSAVTNIGYQLDTVASLTGLLTAQAAGTNNFNFWGICDSVGFASIVKTPFTLGKPVVFGLQLTSTAAHVITYNSLQFFVRELAVA